MTCRLLPLVVQSASCINASILYTIHQQWKNRSDLVSWTDNVTFLGLACLSVWLVQFPVPTDPSWLLQDAVTLLTFPHLTLPAHHGFTAITRSNTRNQRLLRSPFLCNPGGNGTLCTWQCTIKELIRYSSLRVGFFISFSIWKPIRWTEFSRGLK